MDKKILHSKGCSFYMKKHKTREEWIKGFKLYESGKIDGSKYYESTHRYKEESEARYSGLRSDATRFKQARYRFLNKYKQGKISDNTFMKKKKRKTDKEIDDFINNLTDKEKKIIIREHIRQNEKTKNNSKYDGLSIFKQAFVKGVHRTTLYKTKKTREYKYDGIKDEVMKAFLDSKRIYGSNRIAALLRNKGIVIDSRTLRRYMARGGIIVRTRKARKKSESKNTKVKYKDLVKRNFNPNRDTIVATDVSYIPARVKQNNIYLSVAISHKTKMIEAGHISKSNDNQLVIDTLNKLKRKNKFILHSDHGSQYSSNYVRENTNVKYVTSMGRVGNSLDNREVEYFFGCLKGEYLKFLKTNEMNPTEIENKISGYINGYNRKRIQKRLQGKAPATASAYAI